MPQEQKPLLAGGPSFLLGPELEKFIENWKGSKPPAMYFHFLMEVTFHPESVDAGPGGDAHRKVGADYLTECGQPENSAPTHAAAVNFATLYSKYPDFVAGWLCHARQFLSDKEHTGLIARRWLLSNPIKAIGMELKEIASAIECETGIKIFPESTLRRVRDELIKKLMPKVKRKLKRSKAPPH